MRDAISEIVSRGKLKSGDSTQVYRALQQLICSTCGGEIAQDALFTRRSVKGFGLNIMPQCRKCAPFTLQQDKREKSALLQALLREESPDSSRRDSVPASISQDEAASAQEEGRKHAAEEVRRRLGPALKRGRRKFK
jgi:hypothetical protein